MMCKFLDYSKSPMEVIAQKEFKIPVKFIGVGEQATDLLVFDGKQFVEGLMAGR